MVCFVVLHYMVEKETAVCVERLLALSQPKRIVIVDNASPNGSGKRLQQRYSGQKEVIVLLNEKNLGYAGGNNVGCAYAKEKYDPDYYVVMNNDVEIVQGDFISKIEEIGERENFDVLGPDIYSTSNKVHQSPKSLSNMTIEKAARLKKQYEAKRKSKIIVPLRCGLKQIRLLKLFYERKKHWRIHWDRKYANVPLQGSCLIFSRAFMKKRAQAFFPGTFFYFESEILDYECQKAGMKVLYDPSLQVRHHQNVSTDATYKHTLERVHFMNEQNYQSISAFLDFYG